MDACKHVLMALLVATAVIILSGCAGRRPIAVNLWAPDGDKAVAGIRLNLPYGEDRIMSGLDLGLVNSAGNVQYALQAGGYNFTRRDALTTAQIAVWGNRVEGDANVLQIAFVSNDVDGMTNGLQAAFFTNWSRMGFRGIQMAALMNTVRDGDSLAVQLAGLGNDAWDKAGGIQAACLFNNAYEGIGGVQTSLFHNNAGQVKGIQAVVAYNRAESLRGIQLGLINHAEDLDLGLQIGLLNFAGNGLLPFFPLVNFGGKTPVEVEPSSSSIDYEK